MPKYYGDDNPHTKPDPNWPGHRVEVEFCSICDGAGKFLTYECCGRKLTEEEKERVSSGVLDFVDGEWVKIWRN